MREIVYSETRRGIFEPKLTRAEKREAERRKKERSERIQAVLLCLFIGSVWVMAYAALWMPLSFWEGK